MTTKNIVVSYDLTEGDVSLLFQSFAEDIGELHTDEFVDEDYLHLYDEEISSVQFLN